MNRTRTDGKTIFTVTLTFLLLILAQSSSMSYARALPNSTINPSYISEFAVPTPSSGPLAVAADRNGSIWFTESNSSKIGRYTPSTNKFAEFQLPNGTGDMWGITISQTGMVWFTQYGTSSASGYGSGSFLPGGRGTLWSFDPRNQKFHSLQLPRNGTLPFRLTEDSSGRIWFTELLGNNIGMLEPESGQLKEFHIPTANSGPADITTDANGLVWFTESTARSIAMFNPSNSTFKEFRFQDLFAPVGISVDTSGRIWVADHGTNHVGEFDSHTGLLETYPTSNPSNGIYPYSLPNDIVTDRNGEVWLTEHAGNRIARINPSQHSLVEYQIPSGPISTALWLAASPTGTIWFAEYSANQIAALDPSTPIPFAITSDQYSAHVQGGSYASVRLTFSGVGQGLHLITTSTSSPPDALTASFGENPVTIDPASNPRPIVAVDLRAGPSAVSGQYTMAVGASNDQVSVSTVLSVYVTAPTPSVGWGIFPVTAIILLVAFFVLTTRRKKEIKEAKSFRLSVRAFMEAHKISIMILGVASTNFVGAIAGVLHLIILEEPTRTVPLSDAILATYGFYAIWLDVIELALGLITVYTVLYAWKPSKRIASAILLTVLIIASTLIAVSIIPGAKPVQCDIIIRNSLFYGSYTPSILQVTLSRGGTVTWCVDSNSIHSDTVTSDTGLFNSGAIAQGSSWSYTFTEPGLYNYHSILHFWMHGTVNVASSSGGSTPSANQATSEFRQQRELAEVNPRQVAPLALSAGSAERFSAHPQLPKSHPQSDTQSSRWLTWRLADSECA